jgi:hypothetical protein
MKITPEQGGMYVCTESELEGDGDGGLESAKGNRTSGAVTSRTSLDSLG